MVVSLGLHKVRFGSGGDDDATAIVVVGVDVDVGVVVNSDWTVRFSGEI